MKFQNPELAEAIEREAEAHGLPTALVAAVVQVESGGNASAWNPEPRYRWLWNCREGKPYRATAEQAAAKTPPRDFRPPRGLASDRDAEWWGQQASWGPMQVMGAVLRERGYQGHFPGTCNIAVGVRFGCLVLQRLKRRFYRRHGWEGVVAAYNAGSPRRDAGGSWVNQGYVNKIRRADGFTQ